MALKKRNKIEASFSMSSMTDLVFLLLIFFMVVATMVKQDYGLKMQLPKSSNKVGKSSLWSVIISKDIQYMIVSPGGERTELPFHQVADALKKSLNLLPPEKRAFWLRADKSVPINEVVKVMNIAKKAHFKVVLATMAEE